MGNAATGNTGENEQAIYELQRLLLANDALDDSDPANIVRVLRVQAMGGNSEIRLKILQTLPLLVSHRSFTLSESLLAQALSICFHFHNRIESPVIHHTATATLTQLVTLLFDRVEAEQCCGEGVRESTVELRAGIGKGAAHFLSQTHPAIRAALEPAFDFNATATFSEATISAYLLLHDLCLLSSGDRGAWLRGALIPRSLGVELVEYVGEALPAQPQ